jgi:hypothetical protein
MAYRYRTPYSVLIVCALPLVMTACANPETESAATQWSFNGTQYAATAPAGDYSSYEAGSSFGNDTQASNADDWAKKTYVYRGGRDPKTGQASNQM